MAESNYEKMMRKKAEAEARKAEAEAKMMEQRSADRLGMKKAFVKDIAGAGPQKEMRDLQTGAIKDLGSGAAARRGAEAGLRAQIAGAGGRPGGAAAKRGLIKAGEAGVMGAGAQAAGSAAQVAGLAGKVRGADVGISKADKTARMKFHQLRMGEELAREGMKAQVSAASAGRSCFVAGTMVTMANGSKKKIEHVLVGEKVLGLDNKVNTVLDYNRPPTAGRSLYSINDGKAFFTHEHPFYTLKGWKAINPIATFEELKPTEDLYPELLETTSLEIGDELVTVDGVVKIESIKEYEAEFFTQLYNFLLDGDHTYFADEYLVHNGGGKASGGEMLKRLSGSYTHKNGKIKGAGTETSDSIKARLSDGEFVVNAKTVRGLGEALGAKGKHPTRQKGSAYLYALQSKYGDKKDKDTKGILPVKMSAGGFTGMQAAKLASQVAQTGILGKGAKTAGDIAGAGIGAHEAGVKDKAAKAAKAKGAALDVKREKAYDTIIQGAKAPTPAGQANAPKVMGPGMPKKLDEKEAVAKDGGEIKFGKGVKARQKFLDSIGHKPFKHFEDKAEKDYKEGQTGYKNIKKRQSSSVPGFDFGMTAATIAIAAASAAKAEADRKKAIKRQEASEVRQAGVEAGKGLASSAQGIMKQDAELKDGGKVSKDHPHYKFLKDLEDWQEKRNKSRRGKKVDLDPGRKADKAIRAKKGSIEPMKFDKGGSAKKWKKPIPKKDWEDAGAFKEYLENYKKEYAEDPTEINPDTGKPYPRYGYEDAFDEYDAKTEYIKRSWKEMYGKKPHSLQLESIRRIPGNFKKWQKKYSDHMKKGKYVRDPRTGKVVEGIRDRSPSTKEHTPETEKKFLKQKKEKESKFTLDPKTEELSKKILAKKPPKNIGLKNVNLTTPEGMKKEAQRLKDAKKTRGEKVLERLHKQNLKFPKKSPVPPKKIAGIPKTSMVFRPGDKGAKKAPSIPKEIRLEEILKKRVGPKPVDRVKQKKVAAQAKEEREKLANWRRTKKHLRGRAKDKPVYSEKRKKAIEAVKAKNERLKKFRTDKWNKSKALKDEESLKEGPYRSKKDLSANKFKVPDITKVFEKKKEIGPKVAKKRVKKGEHDSWDEESHKKMKAHKQLEYEGKDHKGEEKEDKIEWSNPKVRKFYIDQGRGKEIPEKLKTSTDRNLMAKRVWAKRREDYKKEDPRGVLGKAADVLYTGKTSAWGDRTVREKREQEELKAKPKPKKLISPEEQEPRGAKDKRSFLDKITGGDKAEAKRLGMDVETYKRAKKKAGKGTGLFGRTEEDIRKAAASEKPKVAPKVAPKVVPKTKTPEVKEKKTKDGEMTSKDWADMGLAAGMTGLKAIAKSKQDAADRKRAREKEIRDAKGAAGKSLSQFGTSVMGMDTKLKKGGRVSFKDVLKAKKRMGY